MKIGIDATSVIYGTGVSWYTRNLIQALLKINKEDEFTLFGGSFRRFAELKSSLEKYSPSAKAFPIPPTGLDFLWNRLHILPVELFIGDVDVFHSSDWAQPPTKAYKVTTIHDLAPLRFPEVSHPKIVAAHKARLRWVKKEVDKIIAVSEFTKKEIVELLDIKPEKIVVVYEAPTLTAVSPKVAVPVKKKYKIPGNYLLVVGADPRKNIPAVIQAFRKIRHMVGLSLVIIGRTWERIPNEPGVISLGHLPSTDMPGFYAGASALVYTSLYEGFGLPILDAMQAGCPVVTSNIGAMAEVSGEAAVLVEPTNPAAIAQGVEQALGQRTELIKKGKDQVKKFSWEKAARETLKVYEEARR